MKVREGFTICSSRGRGGFTIVEMLVVVVLIAMIAGVGGGFYVDSYKKIVAQRAAREFYTTLKYARVAAIEKQADCKVVMDAEQQGYWLCLEVESDQPGETNENVIVRDIYSKPVQLSSGVEFEAVMIDSGAGGIFGQVGEGDEIVFGSDGRANSAIIQIGNGDDHYCVQVSGGTGRAKIFEGIAEDMETGKVDLDLQ